MLLSFFIPGHFSRHSGKHLTTRLKFLLLIGFIGISVFSCQKEIIKPQHNANITLYNKPLNVIRANIQGKWKLEYEKGTFLRI